MVRVLAVPAPATMQTGPGTTCPAALCSSSSASSTASARESGSVPGRTGRVCVIGPPSVLAVDVRPPILSAGRDLTGKHPQETGVALDTRQATLPGGGPASINQGGPPR